LKKLIKKLITESSTTDTQPLIADLEGFTKLYNAMIIAEDQNKSTNQKIILRYFLFEKKFEKIFDRFKSVHREC